MPKRQTTFAPGHFYHIFNRGAGKTNIFRSDENYLYLLRLLKEYLEKYKISMIAYCLMPNHYHFLLRQNEEGLIDDLIQRLFNRYVKAFNKRYKRSGALFEGRFKSIHVDSQEYLLHLCRYIHRNPIDSDPPLVNQFEGWPYSNYLEWMRIREGMLIDSEFIKEYAPDIEKYKEFLMEYPSLKERKKLDKYLFKE